MFSRYHAFTFNQHCNGSDLINALMFRTISPHAGRFCAWNQGGICNYLSGPLQVGWILLHAKGLSVGAFGGMRMMFPSLIRIHTEGRFTCPFTADIHKDRPIFFTMRPSAKNS